jgi:hypothetical protein
VIAAALTVIHPRILLRLRVKLKALLEVLDRLHIPP